MRWDEEREREMRRGREEERSGGRAGGSRPEAHRRQLRDHGFHLRLCSTPGGCQPRLLESLRETGWFSCAEAGTQPVPGGCSALLLRLVTPPGGKERCGKQW